MKLRFCFGVLIACALACSSNEDVGSSEARVTVCGQTSIKGIDVYHGDNASKTIDWTKVKADGISFAFVKATESTNYTDSMFATNWAGMKSAGVLRGAYHFFHSDVDPKQQATFFLSTVGAISPGDMLVLDLESANGETQATIEANAATFMSAVKSASGVTPILYVSPAFLTSYTSLASYPLWVANYGVNCPTVPSAWKTYTFWQSTSTGTISAISGALDLDSFNGTLSDLQKFVGLGGSEDAGMPSDAALPSDAAVTQDANAPSDDATVEASTAGDDESQTSSSGCSASPTRTPSANGILMILAVALLIIRRRRSFST